MQVSILYIEKNLIINMRILNIENIKIQLLLTAHIRRYEKYL